MNSGKVKVAEISAEILPLQNSAEFFPIRPTRLDRALYIVYSANFRMHK